MPRRYGVRMVLTPARQRNAVSEGMALGLLVCGRDALPFDKVRLDLAFEGALRSWVYRTRFPQVNTDLVKGLDGVWALTRADANKKVWVLYWEQDGGHFRSARVNLTGHRTTQMTWPSLPRQSTATCP